MLGQVYLERRHVVEGQLHASIENVSNVGVAGSYILIQFEDGSVILEHESEVIRVQFTPYQATDTEDVGQGQDDTAS